MPLLLQQGYCWTVWKPLCFHPSWSLPCGSWNWCFWSQIQRRFSWSRCADLFPLYRKTVSPYCFTWFNWGTLVQSWTDSWTYVCNTLHDSFFSFDFVWDYYLLMSVCANLCLILGHVTLIYNPERWFRIFCIHDSLGGLFVLGKLKMSVCKPNDDNSYLLHCLLGKLCFGHNLFFFQCIEIKPC